MFSRYSLLSSLIGFFAGSEASEAPNCPDPDLSRRSDSESESGRFITLSSPQLQVEWGLFSEAPDVQLLSELADAFELYFPQNLRMCDYWFPRGKSCTTPLFPGIPIIFSEWSSPKRRSCKFQGVLFTR